MARLPFRGLGCEVTNDLPFRFSEITCWRQFLSLTALEAIVLKKMGLAMFHVHVLTMGLEMCKRRIIWCTVVGNFLCDPYEQLLV